MHSFLHNHPDFSELIRIVGQDHSIDPALVEKDYWIMHCLYGLQDMGLRFELKGGTSLSKGYGIIHRFSEDIDIRIEPPDDMDVKTGRNQNKPVHCESRKGFYNWLADTISIDGIEKIWRDESFDDSKYRSGGIRLHYKSMSGSLSGLKEGILLEVGFDDITPNKEKNISSWAYDYAVDKVDIIDNRAKGVLCYHPGYTLVEKLQTISTKYRQQQESGSFPVNFMRHYYDVYCLLKTPDVQDFIGTPEYQVHKRKRFRSGDNPVITKNEAFLLSDTATYQEYERAYQETHALYYKEQVAFRKIMQMIQAYADKLL
ncbi:MAG: nucleotidyl transferase AbiEii/AbiGii toxin family protein [Alphaproteobacteria bacterium]|nr:nucleotidyl transferase AbiEii/AbiGii toxin family protein [Alphaproteobacteria bacterium]